MDKTDNMPMWVFLAFSSIPSRKGALILIWACAAFALYCIPWSQYFAEPAWLATVFRIEDWSWAAMMFPILLWYYLSLRWMDGNAAWEVARSGE